jgi:hypothetical protein
MAADFHMFLKLSLSLSFSLLFLIQMQFMSKLNNLLN